MHVKKVNYNGREGANPSWDDGCALVVLAPVVAFLLLLLGGTAWSGRKK